MGDSIIFRGVERILIVLVAAFFGYLGYKLFVRGISGEEVKLQMKSKLAQAVYSGAAPGLVFMIFGAIVLIYALIHGGATKSANGDQNMMSYEIPSILGKSETLAHPLPGNKEIELTDRHALRMTVIKGLSSEEVCRIAGQPKEIVKEGEKTIFKYDSLDVIFSNNIVQEVIHYDQEQKKEEKPE